MPEPVMMPVTVHERGRGKWYAAIIIVVLLVGLWIYKTDNWPIVAMVGMHPITRYQVDQELFKQGGKMEVDNLVTQQVIQDELNRKGITVSNDELNQRLDVIKANLAGQDLNSALAAQGMTMADLTNQLKLQLGVEKAVAEQATVSTAEVDAYIKSNGSTLTATTEAARRDEAMASLKQQKLQSAVSVWVQDLLAKTKVWRAPGM